MSRTATVRIADLERVFKAMSRTGFTPRVIVRPDGVEVFGDRADLANTPVDTPAPVRDGAGAGDDLDAELAAWQADHDQGEP